MTLKIEFPQLQWTIHSCAERTRAITNTQPFLQGEGSLSKKTWPRPSLSPQGTRPALPLSSLGVAGTAHLLSPADREMEPLGGLALLARYLGTQRTQTSASLPCFLGNGDREKNNGAEATRRAVLEGMLNDIHLPSMPGTPGDSRLSRGIC